MRTDAERLDWLEAHNESLYRVTQAVRVPLTTTEPRYEEREQFLGWSVGSRTDELPTVRAAIDAAMDA